jgi:hypothetical protein
MEDILEVYCRPHDPSRPVVCMDESSKQLLREVRPALPLRPGATQKVDCEYERNGICNLFVFNEPLAGKRYLEVTDRRTKIDWAWQIKKLLDVHYPDVEKVVLVMDNLNTHHGSSLYEAFDPFEARRLLDRLDIHYTPKHGSWLNMAEIELQVLTSQCLRRRIPDKATLIAEVDAWQQSRNNAEAKINWRFTTAAARIKLKRLYPTISM